MLQVKKINLTEDVLWKIVFITSFISSVALALINSRLAYDDITLSYAFSQIIARLGVAKAAISILFFDLPYEYRTYGLSKLLQFLIWLTFGSSSYVYGLTIIFTQFASAYLLAKILLRFNLRKTEAFVLASTYAVSPFAVTACFHHYSYLILPIQITILNVFVIFSQISSTKKITLAILLGSATALTGELHLPASLFVYLFFAWHLPENRKFFVITAISLLASLIIHHTLWRIFAADYSHAHRFNFEFQDITIFSQRIWPVILSIYKGFSDEIGKIYGHVFFSSLFLATIALAFVAYRSSNENFSPSNEVGKEKKVGLFLLTFIALSCSVYFAVSVISGNFYETMPRRYGYISYSLLFICLFLLSSSFIKANKKTSLVICLGLWSFVFIGRFQLELKFFRPSIRTDMNIVKSIEDSAAGRARSKVGILFFNSGDSDYTVGQIPLSGPRKLHWLSSEIRETIFAPYWLSQAYVVNFLGFAYAGIPGKQKDETIDVAGKPFPGEIHGVHKSDVIVVANLGFGITDEDAEKVKVFKNFDEFEPYFFWKRIEKETPCNLGWDSAVFDLGSATEANGILSDKKFSDPFQAGENTWLTQYGLISGSENTYRNPNLGRELSYFSTNHYGNFTYAFNFTEIGDYEICFDFWEQWSVPTGGRVFDLDISWDGTTWANVGEIDPAKINGGRPFSIVLKKNGIKSIYFKLQSNSKSKEPPMIQGVKIRRISY